MVASRAVPLFVVVVLCACAASTKRDTPEPAPPYDVGGSIGLLVTPDVTPVRIRMPDDEYVASADAAAEAKRKEAQRGVGATAFTILVAPLAILAPLYPPAIQLAALPFMAADATATASKEADRLKEKAAQARRDAACASRLSAAHPDVAEAFPRALADPSLRRAIELDLRDALAHRSGVPVVVVTAPRDNPTTDAYPLVKEAKEQALSTILNVEIAGLDLSATAGDDAAGCRYAVLVTADLAWWDVEKHLLVHRNDALGQVRLPIESFDLPALLERHDELRSRIARGFRDAASGTLDVPALRFGAAQSRP